jgi:thioesterase domain-containing protein
LPEKNHAPLVKLRTGPQNVASLFCVPGAGAPVTSFIDLVENLDAPWPVYGLQPRGLDGVHIPHSTVSAAAESYLRAIQTIHPNGPLHLLGHSFGGWVVLDMAQRFLETGRNLASLTILDSEAPDADDTVVREYNSNEVTLKWIEICEEFLEHPLHIEQRDLDSRDEPAQRKLLHHCLVRNGLMSKRSQPDALRGPLRTFATSLRTHFRPSKPYPGPVQLILVNNHRLDQDANRRTHELLVQRWKQWAPNLVYKNAPGNHMTVLRPPHVAKLTDLIQDQEALSSN